MNIDKNHVKTLLNALVNAYPESVKNWQQTEDEIGDFTSLIAHLVYLKDHGYIEGEFKFLGDSSDNQWSISFSTIRINAKGLDYAAELNISPGGMLLRKTKH